jgi:hypothetical protein
MEQRKMGNIPFQFSRVQIQVLPVQRRTLTMAQGYQTIMITYIIGSSIP